MKPETLKELQQESVEHRGLAQFHTDYANKIDDLVQAALKLAPQTGASPLTPAGEVRTRKRWTQADMLAAGLRDLARPGTLTEIISTVHNRGVIFEFANIDNLRSAMSRDERFESHGNNVWGLVEFNNPNQSQNGMLAGNPDNTGGGDEPLF